MAFGDRLLWVDLETTGLDASRHDVIQIAMIVELQGNVVAKYEARMQPRNFETVDDSALKVNGISMEQLREFQSPNTVLEELRRFLYPYTSLNTRDKLIIAGYNVGFDLSFLKPLLSPLYPKWNYAFAYKTLDVYAIVLADAIINSLDLPNHKLETMANHYGVTINAHDAMSDIEATRNIFWHVAGQLLRKS